MFADMFSKGFALASNALGNAIGARALLCDSLPLNDKGNTKIEVVSQVRITSIPLAKCRESPKRKRQVAPVGVPAGPVALA